MKVRYSELSFGTVNAGELKTQEFDLTELIIGRGGKSSLIITDRSLSLEHAVLFPVPDRNDRLGIRDFGSLNGTRINGQVIRQGELKKDDIVALGTFEYRVMREGDTWILLHEKDKEIITRDTGVLHKELTLDHYLPATKFFSLILVAALIGMYVFRPYIFNPDTIESHSVGNLTSHHAFIGKDCKQCHTDPFQPATDKGCLGCHKMTEHFDTEKFDVGPFLHQKSAGGKDCVTCHTEHRGIVTFHDDRRCIGCHAGFESIQSSEIKNVTSWLTHTEFRTPKDDGTLKFNHATHLKAGLRGNNGPETLQCLSCHVTDPKRMQPITYKENCARCHALEFDERLPGAQVPHGNVEEVLKYLRGNYAQMALSGKARVVRGDEGRLKKTGELIAPRFEQESVAKEVRDAERTIFSKTGCILCHTTSEVKDAPNMDSPHFAVADVHVAEHWLSKAQFNHHKHDQVSCESCHEGVKQSRDSSDVLMPKKVSCTNCHASAPQLSNCITCHNFHDSVAMNEENRRPIK